MKPGEGPGRWRLAVTLVALASVAVIVSVSAWYLQPTEEKTLVRHTRQTQKTPITFDDIFSGDFRPSFFSLSWVKGQNKYMHIATNDDLQIFDLETNTTETLIDGERRSQLSNGRYYVSSDQRFILFENDMQRIWRHSYRSWFQIYDRAQADPNQQVIPFPQHDSFRGKTLQYARWAPSTNALVFVVDNNLYFQADPFSPAQQLTSDGAFENIFNGIPDWLYEEEILSTRHAIYWSPSSDRLVYGKFNTTAVPRIKFPRYGPETDVFGDTEEIAYPKAGYLVPGTNTRVTLYMVNLEDLSAPHVPLPTAPSLVGQDYYYLRATWADPTHVMIVWANRPQNFTSAMMCDTGASCFTHMERTQVGGWVSNPRILWIENGEAYLTVLPRNEGSSGHWKQVAYVTAPIGALGQITFLTQGEAEVAPLNGYDQQRRLVFYTSTNGDPRKRHLFRVGLPNADPSLREPVCLTCGEGPHCEYVWSSVSDTGKYFRRICAGPGVPTVSMNGTDVYRAEVLEDNSALKARLEGKLLPEKVYRQIPIGGGYTGWAMMYLPPNFNSSKQYPVIVNTYGGPGSQRVTERFSISWETYLGSSEDVIFAAVDGRGTRARGDDFMHLLHRKIGTIEVEDQLFGGQYFRDEPYVNASRMAIWGGSYGGYVTLHALANESNVFGSGISLAALIDRRFYDTAHTERFMGYATPEDNQEGYQAGNVTRKIEHFRGKNLMLAHGTADDNVHFLTTAKLVKALTEAEIQFNLLVYPDRNHFVRGGNRHLHRAFTRFLLRKCWGITPRGLSYSQV